MNTGLTAHSLWPCTCKFNTEMLINESLFSLPSVGATTPVLQLQSQARGQGSRRGEPLKQEGVSARHCPCTQQLWPTQTQTGLAASQRVTEHQPSREVHWAL